MIPPLRASLYVASAGALVATGSLALGHPVSPALTGGLLAGYVALVGLGVYSPAAQLFGHAVVRVPSGVALTFDDGPHPEHTPRILDLLDARGARGTFFLIGRKVEKHPALAKEIVSRGHAVGAHSFAHDRLYALRGASWLDRDADLEDELWKSTFGHAPVLFRPPVGLTNPRIARLCEERDRLLVAWTIRGRDGVASASAPAVARRVEKGLRKGAIALLHDAAERDDHTPVSLEALPPVLDACARLGLSARTVPEG